MAWNRSIAALRPMLLSSWMPIVLGCPGDDSPAETTAASTSGSTTAGTAEVNTASTSDTTTASTSDTTTASTSDSTTASTSDTTVGADSTTGPAFCEPLPATTNDCCCFATIETDSGVYIENACPTNDLCGGLQIECPVGPDCPLLPKVGGDGELAISDEAALDCILTALRDGTEGMLTWRYTSTDTPGYAYLDQTVHILPDRGVLYSAVDVIDLGGEWSDVTRETLVAPEDFDACLQAVDLPARLSCLLPKPTGGEVLEVCTEGGTYSKF
jgi:hypothetical protein